MLTLNPMLALMPLSPRASSTSAPDASAPELASRPTQAAMTSEPSHGVGALVKTSAEAAAPA